MTWIAVALVLAALAVATGVIVAALRRMAERTSASAAEPVARLETRVDTLSQQLGERIGAASNASMQLNQLVQTELQSVRQSLSESLQASQQSMSENLKSTNQSLTQHLQTSHKSLTELQERLGRLDEATRQVEQVGKSIAGLEQLFASPKLRGGVGEFMLETLLTEVLPGDVVLRQHRLESRGVVVDFAVRGADDRIIPIDSKFPIESFRRLHAAENEGAEDADRLRREFERAVRLRVDEIAGKYISPDDGTIDIALMYLPSEAIYYELAVRTEGSKFLDYARGRSVIPCSPNTLYAYLQAIAIGLRGLQLTQRTRWIQGALRHLEQDAANAREAFNKAQTQLKNASNNIEAVGGALTSIEERLQRIASDDAEPPPLPAEGERRALGPAVARDLFDESA